MTSIYILCNILFKIFNYLKNYRREIALVKSKFCHRKKFSEMSLMLSKQISEQ